MQDADNSKQVKLILGIAALFAFLTYAHDFLRALLTSDFYDVYHYYTNAKLLLQGLNVWDFTNPEVIRQTALFTEQLSVPHSVNPIHSSSFFLLFSPFTLLAPQSAALAWVLFCQAAFFAALAVLFKIFQRYELWQKLCALFLIFSFWPLREDVYLGQPNFLILFLLVCALYTLKQNRYFLSGVFLGAAVQVKEVFLPLILICLLARYRRILPGIFTAFLVLKGSAIAWFGWDKECAYWASSTGTIFRKLPSSGGVDLWSKTVIDFISRLTLPVFGYGIVWVVIAAVVLYSTWCLRRVFLTLKLKRVGEALTLEWGFFITFCFMISPWVHETHFVVLILPLIIVWFYIAEHFRKNDFLLFACAYLILGLKYSFQMFPFAQRGILSSLLAVKVIGYVLLFVLMARLLERKEA